MWKKNARHRGAENVKNARHRGTGACATSLLVFVTWVAELTSLLLPLLSTMHQHYISTLLTPTIHTLHCIATLHCYIALLHCCYRCSPRTLHYIATLLYQQTIHVLVQYMYTLEHSLHFATLHCTKVPYCIPHIPELWTDANQQCVKFTL